MVGHLKTIIDKRIREFSCHDLGKVQEGAEGAGIHIATARKYDSRVVRYPIYGIRKVRASPNFHGEDVGVEASRGLQSRICSKLACFRINNY